MKRFVTFLMFIMLLSLVGCKANTNRKDTVFVPKQIDITGIDGSIKSVSAKDGIVFVETEDAFQSHVYCIDVVSKDTKEIRIPEVNAVENEWIQHVVPGKNETVYYLICKNNAETGEITYRMVVSRLDGTLLAEKEVTEIITDVEAGAVYHIKPLNSGKVVIQTEKKLIVLNDDLSKDFEVTPEKKMEGLAITGNNQIVVGETLNKPYVRILDMDSRKMGEEIPLDIGGFENMDSLSDGLEYDFFYKATNGFYGYDLAAKQSTQLIDHVKTGLSNVEVYRIVPVSSEHMLGLAYDENYDTTLVLYEKSNVVEKTEKRTIILGGLSIDATVKSEVVKFNKSNDEYQIVFKDYSAEEDPITKLNIDLVAGNAPDILVLNDLPLQRYIAKGLLEDLTPYYEADEELDPSDLIDSVREAMEIDGKLYYVSHSFCINTLVGRKRDVGSQHGWTLEEFSVLVNEKGEGSRPFFSEKKYDMLNTMLFSSVGDFLDWEKGQCSFTSPDFKNILQICNTGTLAEHSDDSLSYPQLVKNNQILLVDGYMSLDKVQLYEKMFDEEITYIGYPNEKEEGSYFVFDNVLAITSKSSVKDASWDFIRTFMTSKYQADPKKIHNTPVRKDCLEMQIEAYTTTESYIDEFGNEIKPIESFCGLEDLQFQNEPLSDKQVAAYVELVNHTVGVVESNDEIMQIIQEEAKYYFEGDKTVNEVVDIIQNRVLLYMNENE